MLYPGPLYTGQLCRKYKTTENFGKLSGDCDVQGERYIQGRYIQVNFAENKIELKILSNCPVPILVHVSVLLILIQSNPPGGGLRI